MSDPIAHVHGSSQLAGSLQPLHVLSLNAAGTVIGAGGMVMPVYDYVNLAQASTTDTYTFKTGGSGGTSVATIVVTFTDSGKLTLSTLAKT